MKKNLNNYRNNATSVTPSNVHLHISMLFDKAAILLVQSQEEKENKEFQAYAVSIQKAIKILTSLIGILDPNEVEAINASPSASVQLKSNPWDNYFFSVFTTINEITVQNSRSKLQMLEKSLKEVAKLWKNVGKQSVSQDGLSFHSPSAQSAELTLNC